MRNEKQNTKLTTELKKQHKNKEEKTSKKRKRKSFSTDQKQETKNKTNSHEERGEACVHAFPFLASLFSIPPPFSSPSLSPRPRPQTFQVHVHIIYRGVCACILLILRAYVHQGSTTSAQKNVTQNPFGTTRARPFSSFRPRSRSSKKEEKNPKKKTRLGWVRLGVWVGVRKYIPGRNTLHENKKNRRTR